ncbi:MAG: hypothetical protein M8844_06970 [marine benthic group bacterium]|jgi:hypothetical protein|nr:hypothetical protein [Gemmatimonadota bacterium]MCL7977114.1 hypothetical protein [Gemmatimonadota bacterium]
MLGKLRSKVVRRIALLLLAIVMVSALEPVVGLARDGAVHHETAAEAATHAGLANAAHAHETGESASPTDADGGHEHGSPSDHCTHMHGIACPALPSFGHFSTTCFVEADLTRPVHSFLPTSATPPPNA